MSDIRNWVIAAKPVDLTEAAPAAQKPLPPASADVRRHAPVGASADEQQHTVQISKRKRGCGVQHLQLGGGVLDSSVLNRVDAIAQQSNCVGCEGRGLAEGIAKALPYGCSYKGRRRMSGLRNIAVQEDRATPGTIDARRPPAAEARPGQPMVINMFAQWEMGAALKYNRAKPAPVDSVANRERWFEECLGKIAQLEPRVRSIAFPHQIGCGLAGGNWSRYKAMIEAFAQANDDIEVIICSLKGGAAAASSTGGARKGGCFKCGQQGHWANACPATR